MHTHSRARAHTHAHTHTHTHTHIILISFALRFFNQIYKNHFILTISREFERMKTMRESQLKLFALCCE